MKRSSSRDSYGDYLQNSFISRIHMTATAKRRSSLIDVFGALKIRMGRLHRFRCGSGAKYDSRSWKLSIKDRDTRSSPGNATFVLLNFPVLAIFNDATSSTTKSLVVLHVHLHFISASSIRLQSSPGANHHQILTLIPERIKFITR